MERNYEWFDAGRFGMFIHWGLYCMGAKYTWIKSHDRMTNEQYEKYVKHFNPDRFNPEVWARLAKRAGMRYVVFTAKHHEGYCMFDSQYTDYKYKERDLLRGVIDAFRAEGLKIGVYYSLPDWHHPDYPHDARHPQRDIPYAGNAEGYRAYLHNQVREILTNYGRIDLMWFDGSYPDTAHIWDMPALSQMCRELQPGILISRLPGYDDFATPEQNIPQQGCFNEDGTPKHWEGCQVLHGEWGFIRDKRWKTGPELAQMLVRHASRGGNLLLNVGPTSRGCLDDHTISLLEVWATGWIGTHGQSTTPPVLPPNSPNRSSHATPIMRKRRPSISTFSPGPSAGSTCPIWRARWSMPSFSATARKSSSPKLFTETSTAPKILTKALCG